MFLSFILVVIFSELDIVT